jgi:hypothetical protein
MALPHVHALREAAHSAPHAPSAPALAVSLHASLRATPRLIIDSLFAVEKIRKHIEKKEKERQAAEAKAKAPPKSLVRQMTSRMSTRLSRRLSRGDTSEKGAFHMGRPEDPRELEERDRQARVAGGMMSRLTRSFTAARASMRMSRRSVSFSPDRSGDMEPSNLFADDDGAARTSLTRAESAPATVGHAVGADGDAGPNGDGAAPLQKKPSRVTFVDSDPSVDA